MAREAGLRRAVAEFLGTYLLVLGGAGAVVIDDVSNGGVTPLGVGLSFGLAVMAAIVIFGPVSGAHINPAVSLALAGRSLLSWTLLPLYLGAQLSGAVAAGLSLRALFGNVAHLGATLPTGSAWQALGLEVLLTFFLVLVVFSVATGDSPADPRLAALAIGAYVALAATFAGPVAGASMNPARSFGPVLAGGDWSDHWVYWLGPIAGALAAACVHEYVLQPDASEAERERVEP